MQPTLEPTSLPTLEPTSLPSLVPTLEPSLQPTLEPTSVPSLVPTAVPSALPTLTPTNVPTDVGCQSFTVSAVDDSSADASAKFRTSNIHDLEIAETFTYCDSKSYTLNVTGVNMKGTTAYTSKFKVTVKEINCIPTKTPTIRPTFGPTKKPT